MEPLSSSSQEAQDLNKKPPAIIDLTKDQQEGFCQDSAIDLTGVVVSLKEHNGNEKRKANNNNILDHHHRNDNSSEKKCKRGRQRKGTMIDCSICLESVDYFQGYSLSSCQHTYCRSCLYGYIKSKISSKQVQQHQLKCPNLKCTERLNLVDVRACTIELGDAKCWQAFQEVATEAFLDTSIAASSSSTKSAAAAAAASGQSSSIRRCPTNHCNFTFQYDTPTNQQQQGQLFICPKCHEAYCLHCPVVQGNAVGPAHDDTCYNVMEQVRQSKERQCKLEEWQRENSQADVRFQQMLQVEAQQGLTRPCPKCLTPITKNGGCDHMHCSNCSCDFSWTKPTAKWRH